MLLPVLKMWNQFSLKWTEWNTLIEFSVFFLRLFLVFLLVRVRYKVHVHCPVHYAGIFVVHLLCCTHARCIGQSGILIFVICHKTKKIGANIHPVKPQICADGICMRANILNTDQKRKKKHANKKETLLKSSIKLAEKTAHIQERQAQTNKKESESLTATENWRLKVSKPKAPKKTNHKPVKMAFNRQFDTMRLYFPFGQSLTSCNFHRFQMCAERKAWALYDGTFVFFCISTFHFTLLLSHAIFGLFFNKYTNNSYQRKTRKTHKQI